MDTKQNKIHPLEHTKTFKERFFSLANMEIQLPELPSMGKFREFFSSVFTRMSKVFEKRDSKFIHQDDPDLEVALRRHDIGGSVGAFTQRIWDAVKKSQTVDGSLRKHTIRTRQDEEIQRKQEEINKRNIRLTKLSRMEGWEIDVIGMLRQWENFCYMNLRFPETRKDKVSLENFIGYQNGALWVIEGLRKEVYNAVTNLKKQAIKEKNDRTKAK